MVGPLFEFLRGHARVLGKGPVEGGLGIEAHFIENPGKIETAAAFSGQVLFGFLDTVAVDEIEEILLEGFVQELGKVPGRYVQLLGEVVDGERGCQVRFFFPHKVFQAFLVDFGALRCQGGLQIFKFGIRFGEEFGAGQTVVYDNDGNPEVNQWYNFPDVGQGSLPDQARQAVDDDQRPYCAEPNEDNA